MYLIIFFIVIHCLTITCSNISIFPELTENINEGKLYLEYLPLWEHILNSKKNSNNQFSMEIDSLIYDQFILGLIQFIQKLDLSYTIIQSTNLINQINPNTPKDFELFLNLVEFCKLLLPKIHPEFLIRWIYIFGKELIIKSNDYPLINGFYKLLTIIFKICEEKSYFLYLNKVFKKFFILIYFH